VKFKSLRDWKKWITSKATHLDPRIKRSFFYKPLILSFFQKIETDNIFNEEFNIQPNKRSKRRKEGRYNDFRKFRDGQAGYVTKPTQNFKLELKLMYLLETCFTSFN
jgi:hypothetical protein